MVLATAALYLLFGSVAPQPSAPTPAVQDEQKGEKVFEKEGLRVALEERTLGFKDPAMAQSSLLSSLDGQHMAYVVMAGGGLAVVHDGKQGEVFEAISVETMSFSPTGERFAYLGNRELRNYVVLDGKVLEYANVLEPGVVFSPDGKRAFWIAADEGKQFVVVDGEAQKGYDGIAPLGIVFSADSAHYAYVATLDGKQTVVLDGEEGPFFGSIKVLKVNPEGEVSYIASEGKDSWYPIVGTEPLGEFDSLHRDGVLFSADGKRNAILVEKNHRWMALIDGKLSDDYRWTSGLNFSADGTRCAFLASNGEGGFIVVDGEEDKTWESYESFIFSPTEARAGYTATRGGRFYAIVDDEVVGSDFDSIEKPGVIFSPDSTKWAFVGLRDGKKVVVENGEAHEPFRSFGQRPVGWAPGSNRFYYTIKRKAGESFVVDGKESKTYTMLGDAVFSANGKRYAFVGKRDDQFYMVVDGEERGPFAIAFKKTLAFSPDGERFAFGYGRNQQVFMNVNGVDSEPLHLIFPNTTTFSPDGRHLLYQAAFADKRFLVIDDMRIDNGYEGFEKETGFTFVGDTFLAKASKSARLVSITGRITGP